MWQRNKLPRTRRIKTLSERLQHHFSSMMKQSPRSHEFSTNFRIPIEFTLSAHQSFVSNPSGTSTKRSLNASTGQQPTFAWRIKCKLVQENKSHSVFPTAALNSIRDSAFRRTRAESHFRSQTERSDAPWIIECTFIGTSMQKGGQVTNRLSVARRRYKASPSEETTAPFQNTETRAWSRHRIPCCYIS